MPKKTTTTAKKPVTESRVKKTNARKTPARGNNQPTPRAAKQSGSGARKQSAARESKRPTVRATKQSTTARASGQPSTRGSSQTARGNGQGQRLRAIRAKQTKTEIMQSITEDTGLPRKEISAVLSSVAKLARRHVMKRGSGEFSVPELGVKVRRVQRKARMARNPKTGEPVRVPAKTSVKATVLKSLKDSVA
jgi:nucleoid DNA-binding protein